MDKIPTIFYDHTDGKMYSAPVAGAMPVKHETSHSDDPEGHCPEEGCEEDGELQDSGGVPDQGSEYDHALRCPRCGRVYVVTYGCISVDVYKPEKVMP